MKRFASEDYFVPPPKPSIDEIRTALASAMEDRDLQLIFLANQKTNDKRINTITEFHSKMTQDLDAILATLKDITITSSEPSTVSKVEAIESLVTQVQSQVDELLYPATDNSQPASE